jgi:hypothetical protein
VGNLILAAGLFLTGSGLYMVVSTRPEMTHIHAMFSKSFLFLSFYFFFLFGALIPCFDDTVLANERCV